MRWGFTCSSEEFEASRLVDLAVAAERAGFEFVTVSDHFHPWTERQGHSPFAWTTVGAIAARTTRVRIGTGVTCPLMRYHPTIVAQAAATASELTGGRCFLGLGTGEALNEHIVATRWPAIDVRRRMLVEATEIIRSLWTGRTVDHEGEFYGVENARLFSRPHSAVPVIWAASGVASAEDAGRHADGLWVTSPDHDTTNAYRDAGGGGEVVGQLTLCWARDPSHARRRALEIWPNAGVPGQLSQDLPTWTHFEQVSTLVTEDVVADTVVCGDDVSAVVRAVRQMPTPAARRCTSTRWVRTKRGSSTGGRAISATHSPTSPSRLPLPRPRDGRTVRWRRVRVIAVRVRSRRTT